MQTHGSFGFRNAIHGLGAFETLVGEENPAPWFCKQARNRGSHNYRDNGYACDDEKGGNGDNDPLMNVRCLDAERKKTGCEKGARQQDGIYRAL